MTVLCSPSATKTLLQTLYNVTVQVTLKAFLRNARAVPHCGSLSAVTSAVLMAGSPGFPKALRT